MKNFRVIFECNHQIQNTHLIMKTWIDAYNFQSSVTNLILEIIDLDSNETVYKYIPNKHHSKHYTVLGTRQEKEHVNHYKDLSNGEIVTIDTIFSRFWQINQCDYVTDFEVILAFENYVNGGLLDDAGFQEYILVED